MKNGVIILFVLFTGLMFSACDDSGGCGTPRIIELTEADNGQTVEMNLEDQIRLVLPANHSTGFEWVNMLTEGSFIVQVGDSVYEEDPGCTAPGCGGTEIFTFEATRRGTGAIKLHYMQPWEGVVADEFFVTVVVN